MSEEEKNKNEPKFRFHDFKKNKEWKEYSLFEYLELLTDFEANGSFADVKKNVTVYDEPNFAWYVRATDLENSSELKDIKFVDKHSYEFLRKTSLYGGELLISKRGEIGKVFFFMTKKDIPSTVAPNLYLLKMNEKAIPKFFYYYFTSFEGNQSLKRLNASSTIGALYKDDVKNIRLHAPLIDEQQKIADCLSSLDELITAQNQKLEALREHKKGLMQELFPTEGETVPRRRFEEFRDMGEWEQLAIGSKVDSISGYPFSSSEISEDDTGIPLLRGINITEGLIRHTPEMDRYFLGDIDNLQKFTIKTGDLVIGMDGSKVGKNSALITEDDSGSLLIQRVARLRTTEDGMIQFIFQHIHSTKFHSYVNRINTSGGIPHISLKQIEEFEISFPKTREERKKIADFLSSLDELIAVQAEKTELLKRHKKGLMQGLFPMTEKA